MKLALRELVRQPGRFVTATAVLSLIAILLMFLGGLLDGLIDNATGAIRAQPGEALVYSSSAEGSFLRSRLDPDAQSAIEDADGVTEVGRLGVVLLGARVPGNGPRDLANTAVWGYELPPKGVPEPPDDGEVWADQTLENDGVEIGQTLLVGPAKTPVKVIGWVDDTSYNGQGGLWGNLATWHQVLNANRPGASLADDVVQAMVVRGGPDAATLVTSLDRAGGDATKAYTIDDAVDAIPGVKEQRGTFNQILGVTVVIALVVIALFFALITVERTALYGVLKAIGARTRTLFAGLVVQAVIVSLVATVIAAVVVLILDAIIPPGSIPVAISTSRILISAVLLLIAAIVGCAFSLRRIVSIDPASALS